VDFDLGKELGAEEGFSTQRLTLYLTNKDKTGRDLEDLPRWVDEARHLLAQMGPGSTALPPCDGTWVATDGSLIWRRSKACESSYIGLAGREIRGKWSWSLMAGSTASSNLTRRR
jgi:hypothetical protein